MRIRKTSQYIEGGASLSNTYGTSNENGYTQDYINNLSDVNDYTLTPTYSTLQPSYIFQKIGNIIILNINTIYLASITANTWTNIATIPNELIPNNTISTNCILANSSSGNIEGYGRAELQTNGTIRVKVNTSSSSPFFTINLIWNK